LKWSPFPPYSDRSSSRSYASGLPKMSTRSWICSHVITPPIFLQKFKKAKVRKTALRGIATAKRASTRVELWTRFLKKFSSPGEIFDGGNRDKVKAQRTI
ncbi:MAG: hypothetical protein ABEK10_04265, partial [Candidatus Nanosalina sp.]